MAQVVQNVSPAVIRERIHTSPEQIAAFCCTHHIRWLALFGSVLRDDFRPDSDIDVLYALEPGQKIETMQELIEISDELSALMHGDMVDFIAMKNLKWRIRDRVFAEAQTLYGELPEEVILAREKNSIPKLDMVKDANLYLGDMLDLAREAQNIVASKTRPEYDTDRIFHLAALHLIQTIGEAATHVSQATRANHPAIPWGDIIGMRNVLVHRYGSVDGNRVWRVLTVYTPELIAELERMLPSDMQAEP